jgi:hypothetical protein
VKKPLAALLLSAATVAALAVPAGAAPSTLSHLRAACDSGQSKTKHADVWSSAKWLTVRNGCAHDWFGISYSATDRDWRLAFPPGSHMRLRMTKAGGSHDVEPAFDANTNGPTTPCFAGNAMMLVYGPKDFRVPAEC